MYNINQSESQQWSERIYKESSDFLIITNEEFLEVAERDVSDLKLWKDVKLSSILTRFVRLN